jgi:hypothetical protein
MGAAPVRAHGGCSELCSGMHWAGVRSHLRRVGGFLSPHGGLCACAASEQKAEEVGHADGHAAWAVTRAVMPGDAGM